MNKEQLKQAFLNLFGQEADATFFSPGRINLIGEHTDYNGGHVFPAV
jgi:galactokinase